MLCSLSDDPLIAHGCDLRGDLIGVDQFGIAEDTRALHSEELTELSLLHTYLTAELYRVKQRGEGVRIGLSDQLYTSRSDELLEALDKLGLIVLHLLDSEPRDREAN